jgi:hypothetical protein
LVTYEDLDQWSWTLVFFVPPIGGRVQITQDEGVTRTYVDENGIISTVRKNGQRSLSVCIDCDEEVATEVRLFMAYLETERLCIWKQ